MNGDGQMEERIFFFFFYLKAAYLQIRVADDLHKHQLVRWKGKVYCLTRLGFGLNVTTKIISKILKIVLGEDKEVEMAISSYIKVSIRGCHEG